MHSDTYSHEELSILHIVSTDWFLCVSTSVCAYVHVIRFILYILNCSVNIKYTLNISYVRLVNNLIMITGKNCWQIKTLNGGRVMREQKFTLSWNVRTPIRQGTRKLLHRYIFYRYTQTIILLFSMFILYNIWGVYIYTNIFNSSPHIMREGEFPVNTSMSRLSYGIFFFFLNTIVVKILMTFSNIYTMFKRTSVGEWKIPYNFSFDIESHYGTYRLY